MAYQDIQASELQRFLQQDDLVVIDMRDAASQAAGRLPNAHPDGDAAVSMLVKRRRRAPPVLVYCYHGNRSRDLCGFLSQFGVPEVYNLAGGWAAWEAHQASTCIMDDGLRQWLLSNGFDPADCNSRTARGTTPLMRAALQGDLQRVEALLGEGADPGLLNEDAHHALWFACVNGDPGLVKRLIEAGCAIDQCNINGITCAIYAASAGQLEALRILAEAGADLSIRTPDGFDALDCAATLPVLRFLKPLVRQAV